MQSGPCGEILLQWGNKAGVCPNRESIGGYLPSLLGSIHAVLTACIQREEPGKN